MDPETDLLGDPVPPRRQCIRSGYAAPPGSGPEGKTCRQCAHYRRVQSGARSWPKCNRMRQHWTRGAGSDIRASAPACRLFALALAVRQETDHA